MKPTRRGLVAAALLTAGALAGCARTAPVQDASGEFLGRAPLAQRADQIRAAGTVLGWRIDPEGPGVMRGTLLLRSHQAVVQITYDTQRFAIRYVSSTNLNYENGMIHRNYNSWVQNLRNTIIQQSVPKSS
ncbi:hypothetical protein E2C06_22930 [Dankookia rubra]|uniref:Lipoprotein n=1 Tax=Dankookia rubra TaxID=1442381 RepID=A0A4R5QB34_9PROT|nr:hypothetical protein [Dankookia rubra]TDH60274.1 hypothetical protein E2C06_22930 [Dankookia rubra]